MPVKILMVCLGNICRSPIAEGLLASKLPESQFFVDSCGTGDWHIGSQPDPRSIAVCKKNGLDISNQRGRQITLSDFESFDYIYVMDKSNYQNVIALTNNENHRSKVKLILTEKYEEEIKEVPDPYFGMENGFDLVYEMLDTTCDIIASRLKLKHS
jgi:protein-tyrosine phosphatase